MYNICKGLHGMQKQICNSAKIEVLNPSVLYDQRFSSHGPEQVLTFCCEDNAQVTRL